MRALPFVLLALFALGSSDIALAITSSCPNASRPVHRNIPVVQTVNAMTYQCSNAGVADGGGTLGDLSPQGAALNSQLCDSHCSYRALFPDDPDSPLIPVSCGGTPQMGRPFAINGNAISMAKNQGPAAPYVGTGGNCLPLMIPQAPINLDQQKPPTVKVNKPSPSPSPSH